MAVIVNQKNRTKLRKQLREGGSPAFKGALGTNQLNDILEALSTDHRLRATKSVYDMGTLRLKESKELVDSLVLDHE